MVLADLSSTGATSGTAVPTSRATTPVPYRVVDRHNETDDVVTLSLAPLAGAAMPFRSGQFNMLTAFGVGEAPVSMSSPSGNHDRLEHTVRDAGPVTHTLCRARVGDVVGVRGPSGRTGGSTWMGAPAGPMVVMWSSSRVG